MKLKSRHAWSDSVPHDADAATVNAAIQQAMERDAEITRQHQPPSEFPDCGVCNPRPYVPRTPPKPRLMERIADSVPYEWIGPILLIDRVQLRVRRITRRVVWGARG